MDYPYDPVCFWPGDQSWFMTVTVEMIIRKTMFECGFRQEEFNEWHPSLTDGYMDFTEAVEYLAEALRYVGCDVEMLDFDTFAERLSEGEFCFISIPLPELDGWSAAQVDRYRDTWLNILKETQFFYMEAEVVLETNDNKTCLKFWFHIDNWGTWESIADIFYNFLFWRKALADQIKVERGGRDGSNYSLKNRRVSKNKHDRRVWRRVYQRNTLGQAV